MRRKKDKIIVMAGLEKNMAVESPSGNLHKNMMALYICKLLDDETKRNIIKGMLVHLETACITDRRRKPPIAP